MQNQIKILIPSGEKLLMSEVFGYATRGVPGLEIIGLGKRSRVMREKLNFVSRRMNIKIEPKKYVICIEDEDIERLEQGLLKWLELPFLLLYWSLSESIGIKKLEDCVCAGSVSTSGIVRSFPYRSVHFDYLEELSHEDFKLISDQVQKLDQHIDVLPLSQILEQKILVA